MFPKNWVSGGEVCMAIELRGTVEDGVAEFVLTHIWLLLASVVGVPQKMTKEVGDTPKNGVGEALHRTRRWR